MKLFIDKIAMKLTETNREGWSFLLSKISLLLIACFFLLMHLTRLSWEIMVGVVCIHITAQVWVSMRGLRDDPIGDANIFSLSGQQSTMLRSIEKLSSSMWLNHHEDRYKDRTYTALEEELIRVDRLSVKKIRNNYDQLKMWDDKPLVEAMNLYRKLVGKVNIDLTNQKSSFMEYLSLSELNGKPLTHIPNTDELEKLMRCI